MRPIILAILLLLFVPQSAFSQGVDVQIDTVPLDVLRLSDFDPLNPSATSVFFVVTVTNDDRPRDLAILVSVTAVRAGFLGTAYVEIGSVPPNGIVVRTNQEFETYDVGDAAEDLVDFALERGVLPPVALFALRTGEKPVNLIIFGQALTVLGNPLMALAMLWLANRKDVMGDRRNGLVVNILGGIGLIVVVLIALRVLWRIFLQLT